ncbi:MAG: peptidoglycan-binding protein [Nitratireductor sp.]
MSHRSENIVFSILQEHPSVVAGVCTFAIAFSLVAGNAIYSQSGSHPTPLWATRDHVTTQSIDEQTAFKPEAFDPRVRPVKVSKHKVKINKSVAKAPALKASPIVKGVQQGLADSGDYKGAVDGLMGPKTRAAITTYQARYGLDEDGTATKTLLKIIQLNKSVATKQVVASKAETKVFAVKTFPKDIVLKVQQGLFNFGESNISVDGVYGKQTEAAIKRFQEKFNLTKTGIPDVALVKTLVKKRALPAG